MRKPQQDLLVRLLRENAASSKRAERAANELSKSVAKTAQLELEIVRLKKLEEASKNLFLRGFQELFEQEKAHMLHKQFHKFKKKKTTNEVKYSRTDLYNELASKDSLFMEDMSNCGVNSPSNSARTSYNALSNSVHNYYQLMFNEVIRNDYIRIPDFISGQERCFLLNMLEHAKFRKMGVADASKHQIIISGFKVMVRDFEERERIFWEKVHKDEKREQRALKKRFSKSLRDAECHPNKQDLTQQQHHQQSLQTDQTKDSSRSQDDTSEIFEK